MAFLWGGAVSYERGTPVDPTPNNAVGSRAGPTRGYEPSEKAEDEQGQSSHNQYVARFLPLLHTMHTDLICKGF